MTPPHPMTVRQSGEGRWDWPEEGTALRAGTYACSKHFAYLSAETVGGIGESLPTPQHSFSPTIHKR